MKQIVGKHIDEIVARQINRKVDVDKIPWELVQLASLARADVKAHFNGNAPLPVIINLKLVKELIYCYEKNMPVSPANLKAINQVVKAFYDINRGIFEDKSVLDKLKPEYCDLLAALTYLQ